MGGYECNEICKKSKKEEVDTALCQQINRQTHGHSAWCPTLTCCFTSTFRSHANILSWTIPNWTTQARKFWETWFQSIWVINVKVITMRVYSREDSVSMLTRQIKNQTLSAVLHIWWLEFCTDGLWHCTLQTLFLIYYHVLLVPSAIGAHSYWNMTSDLALLCRWVSTVGSSNPGSQP